MQLAAGLVWLVAGTGTSLAQERYAILDPPPTVTVSEAAFHDLIRRLDAMEASISSNDVADAWKETDTIDKPTHKWVGRIHFDWWPIPDESPLANYLETGDRDTAPQDGIGFRRARIGIKGDINETMEYRITMDFADSSRLAFKDAYLGWNELPILRTLLLGNQKRPYGLEHLNSSRYTVFMERPYVVEAFNQDARRIGLQSYGVSENERWNWRYGINLMDDLATVGHQFNDNYQGEIAGRLANTIWVDDISGGRRYAHWAVSGSAAFPNGGPDGRFRTRPEARTSGKWFDTGVLDAENYLLLGLEGVINIGAFSIVGEYMTTRVDRNNTSDVDFGGGYLYVAYFLTGEHTPWSRTSGTLGRTKPFENFFAVRNCDGRCSGGWGAWQIAARYSHGDFSDADVFGGVGDSFSLGLNWWWNPYARMQFNYINGSIASRTAKDANGIDVFTDASGKYDIFGTRFMVDF